MSQKLSSFDWVLITVSVQVFVTPTLRLRFGDREQSFLIHCTILDNSEVIFRSQQVASFFCRHEHSALDPRLWTEERIALPVFILGLKRAYHVK